MLIIDSKDDDWSTLYVIGDAGTKIPHWTANRASCLREATSLVFQGVSGHRLIIEDRVTDLDMLACRATAFSSIDELLHNMENYGYVPSLRRTNEAQSKLGDALEGMGLRVFWG